MSQFTVTVPASDRSLLTLARLRRAARVADGRRDADLIDHGITVSDAIALHCLVAADGYHPPTLRRETIEQIIRPQRPDPVLFLARQFIGQGSVTVVENGAPLDPAAFEVQAKPGKLYRLAGDRRIDWPSGRIDVTYAAGFDEVPTPLADIAAEMIARRTGVARDPMMKKERIDIPGIRQVEREFWVDASANVDITPDMAAKLVGFTTHARP